MPAAPRPALFYELLARCPGQRSAPGVAAARPFHSDHHRGERRADRRVLRRDTHLARERIVLDAALELGVEPQATLPVEPRAVAGVEVFVGLTIAAGHFMT